jgi:hypothetical protein
MTLGALSGLAILLRRLNLARLEQRLAGSGGNARMNGEFLAKEKITTAG